jgi:uncharacterized lipoprotein YmbA
MIRIGVPLVVVLALASALGCASEVPPERTYYLLRGEPHELAANDAALGIGLGKVEVPPYLDHTGVILEVAANQIREARYHLWAEPLYRGIHYYLEDRIAAEFGQRLAPAPAAKNGWHYRIDVSVSEFHGDIDGDVRLIAGFTLTGIESGEVLVDGQVSFAERQPTEGYRGLVQAQISLLDRLAASIASALRDAGITSG